MAKHLLLNFLTENLGEYVDNLTKDHLTVGVFDGVLEFHNLHLKPLALAKLNLPFIVDDAIIKYLKIVIPWTNLGGGVPVQLTVDGVYVKIRPLDYGELSKEELHERSRQLRVEILRKAEAAAMEIGLQNLFSFQADAQSDGGGAEGSTKSSSSSSSPSSSSSSSSSSSQANNTYLQRLVSKIIANVEVSLRNLHFRYEDARTLAGQTIAAGCTLDELLVVSTDDQWVERASSGTASATGSVNSGGGSSSGSSSGSSGGSSRGGGGGGSGGSGASDREPRYKIAALRNLTAYWNTDGTPLQRGTPANSTAWEPPMAALIYKHALGDLQGGRSEDLHYLLAPPNSMHLRLADRTSCPLTVLTRAEPRLDLEADQSSALRLALDSTQLLQLCLVLDNLAAAERQKMLILFRPVERPTKDPRAWWVYAYRLVTGRDDMIMRSLAPRTAQACLDSRARYVALVKRSLDKEHSPQHATFLACMAQLSVSMMDKQATLSGQMERQFKKLTLAAGASSLSPSEAAEMHEIEQVVPLPALVVFRQLAVRELVETAKRKSLKNGKGSQVLGGVQGGPDGQGPQLSHLSRMKNFFRYGSTTGPPPVADPGPSEDGATSAAEAPKKKSVFSKMFGKSRVKDGEAASGPLAEGREESRSSLATSDTASLDGDGDIEMDTLRAGFGEALWGEAVAENAAAASYGGDIFLLRVLARLEVRLSLSYEGRPLLDALLAVGLQLGTRSASAVKLRVAVTEMHVEDRYTVLPVRPFLVSYLNEANALRRPLVKGVLGASEKLVCEYDFSGLGQGIGRSTLRVLALPLEIVWNAQCVTAIIDMFVTPLSVLSPWPLVPLATYQLLSHSVNSLPAVPDVRVAEPTHGKIPDRALEADRDARRPLLVTIEMEAPKIIIPADSCREDCGFVVLDMGSLSLRATLKLPMPPADDGASSSSTNNSSRRASSASLPPTGPEFSWRLSLSDFCASISSDSRDLYTCASRPSHIYLINPVRLNVSGGHTDRINASAGVAYPPQGYPGQTETFVLIEPTPRMLVQVNAASLGHLVDVIARLVEDVEGIKAITKKADLRRARRSSNFVVAPDDRHLVDKIPPGSARPSTQQSVLQFYADLLSGHVLSEALAGKVEGALRSFFLPKRDPALAHALITIHLPELLCDVLYSNATRLDKTTRGERGEAKEPERDLESISILLSVIKCEIAVRPYDLVMQYSVNSIRVEDSLRPLLQRYLVRSEDGREEAAPDAEGPSLIPAALVQVKQSFDPRSPTLTSQGLDVLLTVQGVVIAVDASAILHAHSVSQVLVERLARLGKGKGPTDRLADNTGSFIKEDRTSFPASPSQVFPIPSGVHESTSFSSEKSEDASGSPHYSEYRGNDTVGGSPSPTRARRASNASSIHTRHRGSVTVGMARRHVILQDGRLAALAELDFKRLRMTISAVTVDVFKCHDGEEGRDSQPLDPVCRLVLGSVRGAMDNRELTSAHLHVALLRMTDERKIATNFSFRTMLECAPSDDGGACSGGEGPSEGSSLVLTYSEPIAHSNLLDVALFNVLSTFALDTLMDTANVAVNIAFAVLTVITPPDAEAVYVYEDTPGNRNDDEEEEEEDDDEYGGDDDIRSEAVTEVDEESRAAENTPGLTSYVPPPPEARAWNIHVRLPDPCIVLLDDPLPNHTRCLVATLTVDVHFGIDAWGSVLCEKQEAVHLTAQSVEVFALPDTGSFLLMRRDRGAEAARVSMLTPRCVCDKFSADLHATRRLERDIVLAANLALRVSDINAQLSLENMHILDSILSRRTLTGLAASRQVHNVTYCIFGARDGKVGTQVDIYVLALSMGHLTITAVNDLDPALTHEDTHAFPGGAKTRPEHARSPGGKGKPRHPDLLRVQFSGASFHGNGALHPRLLVNNISIQLEVDVHHVEGSGFLEASLDFFNPHVSLWEPVVELWRPELLVKKGHHGMLIEISAPRTLQINLSGRMIDGVVKAYSLLLQRAESFRFVQRDRRDNRDVREHSASLSQLNRDHSGAQLLLDGNRDAADKPTSRPEPPATAGQGAFAGPGVLILNRLLCDVEYRLVQTGKYFVKQESQGDFGACIQEGTVEAGLGDGVRVDPTKKGVYSVVFRASSYAWSATLAVGPDKDALHTLDMPSQSRDRPPLVLRVHAALTEAAGGPVLELSVFINAAVVDRTGLRLSARSMRKRQSIVRSAHASGVRPKNELCERLRALEQERRFRRESMHARPAPTVMSSGNDSEESPAGSLDEAEEEAAAESKEEYYRQQSAEHRGPLISACSFASRRAYLFSADTQLRSLVYTDRALEWVHLPAMFLGQTQLRTPCDDYAAKAPALVRFTPSREVLVMVLIDAGSITDSTPPGWMLRDGFRRAVNSCIARERQTSHPAEHHFLSWGRLFPAGREVVLGAAEGSGRCGMHLCAFAIDPLTLNLLADGVADTIEQVTQSPGSLDDLKDFWLHGDSGLCYFHTDDDRVAFGIPANRRGAAVLHWSEDVSLSATTTSKGSMEVVNKDSLRAYQLCYSVTPLPGLFNRTRVVTVMPHYCIVNCMDEAVEVRQQGLGSDEVLFVEPFHSSPWHKTNHKCSTKVHLRALSTLWSYGAVDINEVGSSVVLLPSADWFQHSANHDAVVAHVEVKLAEPSDNCAVCVVIWKASRERGSMISVKNDSDLPVTIQQAGVFVPENEQGRPIVLGSSIKNTIPSRAGEEAQETRAARAVAVPQHPDEAKFSVCVAPGVWQPFGWADPEGAPIITVTIGTPPHGPVQICTTLGLLRLNEVVRLMTSEAAPRPRKGRRRDRDREREGGRERETRGDSAEAADAMAYSCVYIAVQALGSGRVVRIVRNEADLSTSVRVSTDDADDERKPISKTATGAIVGGVVVGSLILGPIAGALLAGAGIYAVSRSAHKGKRRKRDKALRRIADKPSEPTGTDPPAAAPADGPAPPEAPPQQDAPAPAPASEPRDDLSSITADYSAAVCFRFASLSFSLTVEKPTRRELLSLFVEQIEGSMRVTATARSFELSVRDVQLDSYSETALYPVVLHALRDDSSRDAPLLQFIVVEEAHPETATQHFKYIAVRLLELSLCLDSATMQLLLTDLGSDFSLVSREQALAVRAPAQWVDEYLRQVLLTENCLQLVDVYRSQSAAQAEKVYIENLVLHPIKVTLSFTQTVLPRSKKEASVAVAVAALSYIPAFATVDSVALRLNSFIVSDVMESSQSLVTRILAQALRDLQMQLARLAGSLTMLGRPVGLARNVGGGVQAFFYEPYQGAMKSPSAAVIGVGKGTGALFGGFVTGALNSTASIVSTATAGISQGFTYMHADEQFAQRRADTRMRAQQAAKEGIISGLMEGGYSAAGGFVGGIGGLFTTPVEHALADGPRGFVTGIGMGLVGVPVRAVLGITDALNSVAQTVIVHTSDRRRRLLLRPARAYDCLTLELLLLQAAMDDGAAPAAFTLQDAEGAPDSNDGPSDEEGESEREKDREREREKAREKERQSRAMEIRLAFSSGAYPTFARAKPSLVWLHEQLRYMALLPFDLAAAYAQQYVLAYAAKRGWPDAFLGYALLERDPRKVGMDRSAGAIFLGDCVLLTLRGLIWRRIYTVDPDRALLANSPASEAGARRASFASPPVPTPSSAAGGESSQAATETEPDDSLGAGGAPSSVSPPLLHISDSRADEEASEAASSLPPTGDISPNQQQAKPAPMEAAGDVPSAPAGRRKPKSTEDVRFFPWSDVSHARLVPQSETVEVMTSTDVVSIRCRGRARVLGLYSLLLRHRQRMLSPAYLLSVEASMAAEGQDAAWGAEGGAAGEEDASGSAGPAQSRLFGADTYRFGSANYRSNYYRPDQYKPDQFSRTPTSKDIKGRVGGNKEEGVGKEEARDTSFEDGSITRNAQEALDVLTQRVRDSLGDAWHQSQPPAAASEREQDEEGASNGRGGGRGSVTALDPSAKWRGLDDVMYHLVSDWQYLSAALGSTRARGSSRCVCLAVINGSRFPIQLLRAEMVYGRALSVLAGFGYSKEARTLLPGGCVVLFLAADKISLFGSGHAKALLQTAAFSATLSTRNVTIDTVATPNGVVPMPARGSDARLFDASTGTGSTSGGGGALDRVRVLEKTRSEWWIKAVLLVTKAAIDQ